MTSSEEKYPLPADEFPKKGSSSSGSEIAYSVQARLAYPTPREVCGHLLDLRWTTLHFSESHIGVPRARSNYPGAALSAGLLSYQAAQAMRWWFLAEAEKQFSCLCIETRLVKHRVQYSCSETAESAHDYIGGESRGNVMPEDFHKKPEPADVKAA